MPPCDSNIWYGLRPVFMVSILVLVDAALRLALRGMLTFNGDCFNPCFSGCRPATNHLYLIPNLDLVSILVLVDAALRRFLPPIFGGTKTSFNPCFSGCRPAT